MSYYYDRDYIPTPAPEPPPSPTYVDDDNISSSSVWSSEKSVSKFHPYVFQIQESGGHYYMKNDGLFTTLKTLVDKYASNSSTSSTLKTATMCDIFCFIGTKIGLLCTHCESGKVGSTNTIFMDFEYTTSSNGTLTKHPVHLEIPENYTKGTTGTVIGNSISVTLTPDE